MQALRLHDAQHHRAAQSAADLIDGVLGALPRQPVCGGLPGNNARPASESCTWWVERSNSVAPSSRSRFRTPAETADCTRCSRSDAREKLLLRDRDERPQMAKLHDQNVIADRDNRQRRYALRTNGRERSMLFMTRASRTQVRIGFIGVALAFATALAFTTLPAPLWSLYAQRDSFSSLIVTVVFAAYAVGVALSLFLVGHVSDWYGRRRVLLPALLLNVLAAVVFVLWPALPGLLVARVISGLGIGAVNATATAWLMELHAGYAGPDRQHAEIVAAGANLGGLGAGALVVRPAGSVGRRSADRSFPGSDRCAAGCGDHGPDGARDATAADPETAVSPAARLGSAGLPRALPRRRERGDDHVRALSAS